MSIFINKETRVIVQGITGKEGKFHTSQCIEYGTRIVAGVTPGKGGQIFYDIPVFNTVFQAKEETKANCSIIFVPPSFAVNAIYEAIDSNIETIVCITEGIPIIDMLKIKKYLKNKRSILIGPNCPGIITPSESKVGIMPGNIHKPGSIGVISRSGTLTYEVVNQLSKLNIGQSTCIGIGGDPIIGTDFISCLKKFKDDDNTEGILMVGEIGGDSEEKASYYIKENLKKPVVGFIAGLTAPPGKRMGHAGAIIKGNSGTAKAKIDIMRKCGIHICENLGYLGKFCSEIF